MNARFEDDLRRAMREGADQAGPVDTGQFLGRVHRGARIRRTRRTAAGVAGTVAVVALGGYALGASGLLHQTNTRSQAAAGRSGRGSLTNAGRTPTKGHAKAARSATGFLSLSATGTNAQYILRDVAGRGCPSAGCAVVSVTQNAGRTWRQLPRLPAAGSWLPNHRGTVDSVRFAGDGRDGWAYGGALLSTHDYGRTWNRVSLPVPGLVTRLEAWGSGVYAAAYDPVTDTALLLRSPAGAERWSVARLGMNVRRIDDIAVSQQVVAVLAGRSALPGHDMLLTSRDGRTWSASKPCTSRSTPSAGTQKAAPTSLSTTATSLWAVCASGQRAYVVVSVDGGASWRRLPDQFTADARVAARDATTAVVTDPTRPGVTMVGVGGTSQHITGPLLANVSPIGFTNPRTGYLQTGAGGVLRTRDGGATWAPYPLP